MSALNVTQEEAELLITGLNMYADVQRNASGAVSEDVKVLLAKLAPAPAVPAVEEVVEAPKAKKAKAVEASPAEVEEPVVAEETKAE